MRIDPAEFDLFWQAAARPLPVLIVGGGRWGRVWASVLAAARASMADVTMVARQDPEDLRRWRDAQPGLRDLTIEDDLQKALAAAVPVISIIASRPRDHLRDGFEALAAGSHILVEKPLASTAADASFLVDRARQSKCLLGVGTEFALHPAFQFLADISNSRKECHLSARLEWIDPVAEVRHGLQKSRHAEISVFADILPHAASIFRALRPEARFQLTTAGLSPTACRGQLDFSDQDGNHYVLQCDAEGAARRRHLTVQAGGKLAGADFSLHPATVWIDGHGVEQPERNLALDSTLRLEFGAFVAEVTGLTTRETPLTRGLDELVALQAALEGAFVREGS